MKNYQWLIAALAVLLAFGLMGCPTEGEEEEGNTPLSGTLSIDYPTGYKTTGANEYVVTAGQNLTANYDGWDKDDVTYKWYNGTDDAGTTATITAADGGVYKVEVVSGSESKKCDDVVYAMEAAKFSIINTWKTTSFNTTAWDGDPGKPTAMTETVTITPTSFKLDASLNSVQRDAEGKPVSPVAVLEDKYEHLYFTIDTWTDASSTAKGNMQTNPTTSNMGGVGTTEAAKYTGYTLTGTTYDEDGYAKYTTMHVFVYNDGSKLIRGYLNVAGTQTTTLINTTTIGARIFAKQ